MRAMGVREFGGRDKLELLEVAEPTVMPDGVLIRIRAAAANPVDWKMREGRLTASFPHIFPVVIGWDAAGVVERVGPAVTRFAAGDEVFAYCRKHFVGEGTYAELVSVPETSVAHKPRSLDFREAAGIPLAGLTAFQAVLGALAVRAGETLLVHAAAGGVGSFAVQIGVDVGARVFGTASAANHDYVRGFGAEDAIDYRDGDVAGAVRELVPDGVDCVLDLLGGETLEGSVAALRDGGRLCSIAQPPFDDAFRERGIEPHYVFVRPNGEQLADLARMADERRLQVHVHEVCPLEEAARAHELLEDGHVRGKIAIDVAD